MELLESALKRSINWSIKNRRQNANKMPPVNDKCPIERMNQRIQDESHIRAFTTHFKIELNNLIDLKRDRKEDSLNDESDSFSDDELDSDVEEIIQAVKQFEKSHPTNNDKKFIKINGKHFGLYNIDMSEQQQQLDMSIDNQLEKMSNFSDIDDGYRSLSRSSFRTNLIQQLNDIKSRLIDLLHEIDQHVESRLNKEDIEAYTKRRKALISKLDLLIDNNLEKLVDDKLNSTSPSLLNNKYRAKSSLGLNDDYEDDDDDYHQQITTKIDYLNNSKNKSSPLSSVSSSSRSNSLKRQKSKSSSSLLKKKQQYGLVVSKNNSVEENNCNGNREYEEQVHVIDYDSGKRASESNSSDNDNNSNIKQEPLILSSSSTTKINVGSQNQIKQNHSTITSDIYYKTNLRERPIDFGAMMKNYEHKTATTTSKSIDTNCRIQSNCRQPLIGNKAQHVASNSSTSTYSASSHTSSSSFL